MRQAAFVYLIKISGFLGNPETHIAQYYLGSTIDLKQRMEQHRSNAGAAILRACNERGIDYKIIKIQICPSEAVARELERKLKAYKSHKRIVNLNWRKIMNRPTVKTIRQQVETVGTLNFLSKVKKAIEATDPAIASELNKLILAQKVLK